MRRLTVFVVFLTVVVAGAWWLSLQYGRELQSRVLSDPRAAAVDLSGDVGALVAVVDSRLRGSDAAWDQLRAARAAGRVVALPNGTRARLLDRQYLIGGRLIAPYPTTLAEMRRRSVIEVDRVVVADGPYRGAEGWVDGSFARPVLAMP